MTGGEMYTGSAKVAICLLGLIIKTNTKGERRAVPKRNGSRFYKKEGKRGDYPS